MSSESSYKQIVKTTGIYGSSQLVNVVLGIVRSKLTAIFLGTMGVGVFGILQSVIDFTRSFSGLGLDSGATKELATIDPNDGQTLGENIYVVNVWYLATALLGALVCIVFARPLSFWAFENYDYTLHIMALSVAVFFVALHAAMTAVLQGLRKITFLAIASTVSSLCTLVVMIPVYYYWEIKGIVPMLILANAIMFSVSFFFYRKLGIKLIKIPNRETLRRGKGMLQLGLYIVVAGVLSTTSLFIVRAYINRAEGIDNVGLFQAAWVITTLFWGIILRSANTDFFPKLCSIIDNRSATKQFVNEQTHFILLVVSPLVIGLVTFSQYILHLLYTSDFISATDILRWHLVGAFFKIASTPLATIMLAKNRGGVHLLCESVYWGTYLLAVYLLYPFLNLTATGVAYLVAYIVYMPTVFIAGNKLTGAMWSGKVVKILLVNLIFIAALLFVIHCYPSHTLACGTGILLCSLAYSLYHFKSVINIKEIVKWIKNRF